MDSQSKILRILKVILLLMVCLKPSLSAADDNPLEDIKFDPGSFIFDHIGDAYDWHLFDIGDRHYSIPLPVILYSREKGLDIFMSHRFNHGYNIYRGYKIMTDGPEKGKIVIVREDGTVDPDARRPLDLSITKNVTGMFFAAFIMLAIFLTVGKR